MPDSDPSQSTPSGDPGAPKAVDRFQIFEAVALERLRAGADHTKAAHFLPLPVRLTAIAAASIAGLGLLWSVLARVPIQVNGLGAVVQRGVLGTLVAQGNGVLRFQVSGLGPNTLSPRERRNNAVLRDYWIEETMSPVVSVSSMQKLTQITSAALSPTSAETLVLPEDQQHEVFDSHTGAAVVRYPAATLLAVIDDGLAHQDLDAVYQSTLPSERLQRGQQLERKQRSIKLGQLNQLQQKQQLNLERELKARQALYQRYQALWKQGYLPGTALLEEQTRINNLKAQLLNSSNSRLTTSMNQSDQLDQAKQAQIANAETRMKLENQLVNYLSKTRLFAPAPQVYILNIYYRNGSLVKQGDEILSYTTKPPELPNQLPVFLDGTAAQQVNEGMDVLMTPRGTSRAQYGGIRGTIVEISKLPVATDNLVGGLGSRAMATQIQQHLSAPYVVWVKPELAEPGYCRQVMSRRCYRWSSGRVPPHPVRLNSLMDVQITTGYQRPIEFVMPALKKLLGLVVDNTGQSR